SIIPSSRARRGRSPGRRTTRASSRRAASRPGCGRPSTRTGTGVRIRERFERLRRPATAVDTHDVSRLRGVILRTGVIRLVLAGGALALVLAAAASARDPQTSENELVPPDRIGVVVLDLSLSITDDDYATIRRTLRRLVAEDASIGLAVFSDTPYELLPPGTPAKELQPVLRLLVAPRLGPVRNPWTQT